MGLVGALRCVVLILLLVKRIPNVSLYLNLTGA